ncbi:MAG: threonylcarbamoyl-AMP synthase [Candidatus Marinimicrobia bacterium]|nr:threonylcarbamoyl-AMP synthase [Candidatus Neomarinimicrobiota bacterium]MCF7829250.1 threonylcarbamoyl-AMP synthase [Candidatus Neomarinimicrobiota bacterium]MCF7881097.1 threonylcarbamoyl-AMP synthase [Candidatus Neomarinimicrobiota bacterium]
MSNETIQQAVQFLHDGEIIAYPTDTLFGLGVDALNEDAIDKLYVLKNRSKHRPMSIMVPQDSWRDWVRSINPAAEKLAEKYYPGPITLIMNAGDKLPKVMTRYTNGTIGVRVPNHPVCLELLDDFSQPIITTSANLSNQPAAKNPGMIEEYFGEGIAYIITEGPSPGGIASTIIDVSEKEPVVLREGAISEFSIWRTLQ